MYTFLESKKTVTISCQSIVGICSSLEVVLPKKQGKQWSMNLVIDENHHTLCQLEFHTQCFVQVLKYLTPNCLFSYGLFHFCHLNVLKNDLFLLVSQILLNTSLHPFEEISSFKVYCMK